MVVLAAVGMATLLGFVGLVVDVGRVFVVRQALRNACDAAVGAGASRIPIEQGGAVAKAFEYYCRNAGGTAPATPANDTDQTVAGTGDVVRITTPFEGNARRIRCTASRTVSTTFMQILGIRSQVVSAYAVGLQIGRSSNVSLLAPNYSAKMGDTSTQFISRTRSDGERYAIVIEGNDLVFGVDGSSETAGLIATSQNIYVDSNNTIGKAMYGDTSFDNYTKGNEKTSPELLNPAPGAPGGMSFLDPNYYLAQAKLESGGNHVFKNSHSFNGPMSGFYFVYGDAYIGKNAIGTATIAATGSIITGETGQALTFADTQNKILFYAGANPSLDPTTYFASSSFDPAGHYIHLNDNNTTYRGSMYAPYGNILVESNMTTINGSLIGDTISFTTYANNVTVKFDKTIPPPISPGMLLIE